MSKDQVIEHIWNLIKSTHNPKLNDNWLEINCKKSIEEILSQYKP